ncbi:WXG100 family type VII secretion target [Streptosporangium sp. NPDC087985]|uniref:WXG100 family type VII secretion target n=1 Tax=Streptosporangium sp. NPDC087985 TaxID=3366196 RepID=UPI0037F25B4F
MADIKDVFDEYGADAAKIKLASEQVVDTAQFVDGLRRKVAEDTQALTASGWLGAASAKFLQAMTKWDEQAMIVRRDLETIASNMGQNSVTYSANDQDVQSGMNRVDSLINAAK